MKKHFKITYGFGKHDFVAISLKELPKAYYAFTQHANFITESGVAIRGKDIMRIEDNWSSLLKKDPGEELNWQDEAKMRNISKKTDITKNWAIQVSNKAIDLKNPSILKDYTVLLESHDNFMKKEQLLLIETQQTKN
jgi:hypothetical protein